MSLFKDKPSGSAPKPPAKPVPKPSPFQGRKSISVKEMMLEAKKKPVVIPGTGGQKMWSKQYEKLLKERIPPKKFGTELSELERKTILRQMRKEDKGIPGRERRTLEEKWGLKGKY